MRSDFFESEKFERFIAESKRDIRLTAKVMRRAGKEFLRELPNVSGCIGELS